MNEIEKVDPNIELNELLKHNPLFWGKMYVPEHFRDKSPRFHLIILREAVRNNFFAVAAPRESAKSTIITFLMSTHGICLKMYKFIVILQNTFSKASESLNTIKNEIRDNPNLVNQYGIEISRDASGDSIFVHPDGFKTRVLCKGMEQIGSIRGEKFGAYRPDLMIGDDIEDDIMVKNPELRQGLKDLFDQAFIPAGQRGNCKYLVIGTILHDDSLMATLVNLHFYPEWKKLLFKALWKNTVTHEWSSLWKEKWTVEDLQHMQKIKPDVFAKEYQNDPVSGMLTKFRKEDFRRWYIEEDHYVLLGEGGQIVSKGELKNCNPAISCDLAIEEKRTSDDTVIMPGLLTPNSDLLIDEYICEKGMQPHQFENYIFTMEEKYRKMTGKLVPVGFEKGKLEKFMKKWLERAQRERNHVLYYKDLVWGQDKIERIVTRLQPRYRQHMVYHRENMGELEFQLMRIPSGTHDDLADAAQGLVQLLHFPPSKKKEKSEIGDEGFEFLMKLVKKSSTVDKTPFVFGRKEGFFKLPAKKGWM